MNQQRYKEGRTEVCLDDHFTLKVAMYKKQPATPSQVHEAGQPYKSSPYKSSRKPVSSAKVAWTVRFACSLKTDPPNRSPGKEGGGDLLIFGKRREDGMKRRVGRYAFGG